MLTDAWRVKVAMYTRASASDYDDWATIYGNRGWSAADLLPLLRKVCRPHEYLTKRYLIDTYGMAWILV